MSQAAPHQLRVIRGFRGQAHPGNASRIAQALLSAETLSSDAKLVVRDLVALHAILDHAEGDDDFIEVVVCDVAPPGMPALLAQNALAELEGLRLIRVEQRVSETGTRIRIRFDYEALGELVGIRPTPLGAVQHNAPIGLVATRPSEAQAIASSDIERHPLGRE